MKKIIILLAIIILVALGFYFFQLSKQKVEKPETSTYTLTEEEIEKLNHYQPTEKPKNNEYAFRVSSAPDVYPKFSGGVFSKRPKEVRGGEKLWAKIKIDDPTGLAEVKFKVVAEPDFEKEVAMVYNEEESNWQVETFVPESVKEIIWTNFFAKNKAGQEDKLELAWGATNTCPLGIGNLDYSSLITASGCDIVVGLQDPNELVAGTQTGRITIGNKTINLSGSAGKPAYLIFGTTDPNNRGVNLTGTGKITLPMDGGSYPTILIGYNKRDSVRRALAKLCVKDADSDKFLAPGEVAGRYPVGESCPSDYREAKIENYPTPGLIRKGDCDDNNSGIYPGQCRQPTATYPRQKCDPFPSLSGNWVSSCGDGEINCSETCERGQTQAGFCPGIQYCTGFELCQAGSRCSISPSNCNWCNGGCCPNGYEYCFGTKCCVGWQPPEDRICVNPEGTGNQNCPSGQFCCGGSCCPNGTICNGAGGCISTTWSSCGPLAFSSPDFRIAVAKCTTPCNAGATQSCSYSHPTGQICNLFCSGWESNCPGSPE